MNFCMQVSILSTHTACKYVDAAVFASVSVSDREKVEANVLGSEVAKTTETVKKKKK